MTNLDVLVVEDDEGIREPIVDLLIGEGYTVTSARNGKEALGLLDAGPRPKMIFLDLMMPEMDGKEVLRSIRARDTVKHIPVVLMTAWRHREPELAWQANDILEKPIDTERLLKLCHRY